jgi:gamma-tubulin complex component 3
MARQSHSWVEATDGDALELALLRDCLYAFQGIEGRLIKFDPVAEAHILHPSLSLSYGPGALDVVLHVTEMGWLFRKISEFAGRARRSPREMGVVGQALGHVLEDEITEYYRLMAVLETQLNEQEQQDHRLARRPPPPTAPCAHDTSLYSTFTAAAARPGGLTLRRLAVWVEEPLQRLRLLGTMCDSMHHVRGGALISVLHLHSQQGDSVARSLIHRMLARVSLPLFEMLRRWILEGELSDAHGEFFVVVVADPQGRESRRERAPGLGAPHAQDSDESLWHHRYALRPGMIPRFLPEALAHKILVLGKSINFMRRCCCDQGWSDSEPRGNPSSASTLLPTAEARHARHAAELYEISHDKMDGLQGVVDGVAAVVNARLLSLLMGPRYQLMTHLRALKKFITLAQGDFVTCLLDAVGPELSKSADQLYRHDLTGKLEAALRTSNAQYEDTDILNRVGVRLLPASGGKEGWEVFVLDYHVHAPVSAVVHRKALETYGRIFQLLFRVKRVEWALGTSWKEHMMVGQLPRRGGGGREEESRMACILQRCNLTRREMVHFVANLSSFMWFEVLEASWTQLEADIGAASDLDAVIAAHDAYLLRVTQTSFLSPDKAPFLTALQDVLSSILGFCALHADLCREVLRAKELDRASEKAVGRRGVVGEERAEAAGTGVKREGGIKVGPYEERVEATTARFERACEELIDLLHAQDRGTQAAVAEADAVRFLVFRLDFNLFYTHQRLARGRRASFDKPAVPVEGSIPVL